MKVIGIMTANFRFFYELVQILKEHREPFVTLDLGDDIPANVGVVITTREERPKVRFRRVVSESSPLTAYKMAHSRVTGRESFDTLVAGIDPGRRPGLAVIGDGRVLSPRRSAPRNLSPMRSPGSASDSATSASWPASATAIRPTATGSSAPSGTWWTTSRWWTKEAPLAGRRSRMPMRRYPSLSLPGPACPSRPRSGRPLARYGTFSD